MTPQTDKEKAINPLEECMNEMCWGRCGLKHTISSCGAKKRFIFKKTEVRGNKKDGEVIKTTRYETHWCNRFKGHKGKHKCRGHNYEW